MHGPALYDYVDLPALPPSVPRRGNALTRGMGRLVMGLLGWRFMGAFPDTPKFVVVAAPHTSNWDGVVSLAAATALGLEIYFVGKHTLFRGPFGWFVRAMGGLPVDRTSAGGMVDQAIREFRERDAFVFGLAPEGTRKRAAQWKTGFHRIAGAADVPVVLLAFDYATKRIGALATIHTTSEASHDLAEIAGYYRTVRGKNPQNFALPGREAAATEA